MRDGTPLPRHSILAPRPCGLSGEPRPGGGRGSAELARQDDLVSFSLELQDQLNAGESFLRTELNRGGGIDEIRSLEAVVHPDIGTLEVEARIFLLKDYPHTLHSASQSRFPARDPAPQPGFGPLNAVVRFAGSDSTRYNSISKTKSSTKSSTRIVKL